MDLPRTSSTFGASDDGDDDDDDDGDDVDDDDSPSCSIWPW